MALQITSSTSGEAPKSSDTKQACFHSLKLRNRQLVTSSKVFYFGSTRNLNRNKTCDFPEQCKTLNVYISISLFGIS